MGGYNIETGDIALAQPGCSVRSSTGSTLRKRPVAGSYSRAPRWVRPVSEVSSVPTTKPLLPAQDMRRAPDTAEGQGASLGQLPGGRVGRELPVP